MTRLLLAALVAAACFVPTAAAQGSPPVIGITSWKCDLSGMGDVLEMAQNQMLTVAQEAKEEGHILDYASMRHDWGDEWNFVTLTVADDMAALDAAATVMGERHDPEDVATFLGHCTSHRDAVHAAAWRTESQEAPAVGSTVGMSYFACPFTSIADIAAMHRQYLLPAAQASVDEGMGTFVSGSVHHYGDEWTYVIWRAAEDLPSFFAFNDDVNQRAGALFEAADDDGPNPMDACTAHKDNLYVVVAMTE